MLLVCHTLMSTSYSALWASPIEDESSQMATFVRGINLNGPALEIDGNRWLGNDAKDFECSGNAFENQSVILKPKTDDTRQLMLRSSRWGTAFDVKLKNLVAGNYRVFLYVWEDNNPEQYEILLNDRTVLSRFVSGKAGEWKRLGPWNTSSVDGAIKISARGGAANFSGVEIWSAEGNLPTGNMAVPFNRTPTADQLAFFEAKIRPVLVEHCYECHSAGASEVAGGLLLDSFQGILSGGDTEPPVLPRNPQESLLIKALRYDDTGLQMPPEKKLDEHQIQDFVAWIEMGAPDPRTEDTVAVRKARQQLDWEKARDYWSLRPLTAPALPEVEKHEWVFSDLDRFVLSGLERHELQPSEDASREVWLRRATYALTGLPPEPKHIDDFVKDSTSDAFAKVVDRLLATPEYGERWGRHWLDVVRYSDTAGDNSDFPIPQMTKYRDWVIDAFNDDMPYDQFVREQLAGDLMPGKTSEESYRRVIATGYVAGARRFGSRVADYPQHLTIEDTLDNLGRAFLATSINCARCHDHKFDPVTTEDYYALYGIFHSTRYPWPGIELEQKQRDLVPLAPAEVVERENAARAVKQKELEGEIKELEQQKKVASDEDKKKIDEQLKVAREAVSKLAKQPAAYELAYAIVDATTIEDAAIQIKGDPAKPGKIARRHFLSVLGGQELPENDPTSGRLALANWIVDRNNPLTARVLVNRIWLYHFGRGIVPTPNDFGRQGKLPSHPELLDWLANRLIESNWSIKSLHREIMLSHTYRLSSHRSAAAIESDPTNEWLSSFPRRRLDAESIRDTLLLLSGSLDPSRGGSHPFPPQSEWKFTQHNPFKAVYETNRRSVYLMTQRIQRHPYLAIFDGADPAVSTAVRPVSTTPLQALYFLNDPFFHKQSAGFATWLIKASSVREERIRIAYRRALGRFPSVEEIEQSAKLLQAVESSLRSGAVSEPDIENQVWQSFARSLFRLNEFVYLD
jgi:hypothetical protein